METINELKEKACQEYSHADSKGQKMLETIFGKRAFQSIMERVQCFEEACQETGRDPNDSFFSSARRHENALRKIEEVVLALNEGKVMTYSDSTTDKWYVWLIWDDSISGFRFGGVNYASTAAYSGLGPRLAFASRELAVHFAKYFMPLINESLS